MEVVFANRTIQLIGGGSRAVTLPDEILTTLHLSKGNCVDLRLVTGNKAVNNGQPAVVLVPAENPPKPKK
jgi:antitoxin component of MazEF toxin-antitoxin module